MDIITGHRGTSHVSSQDMRDANMGVIGENNYILNTGGKLAATATGANEVTIADGVLCMQGCVAAIGYGQSEVITLQAGTAGRKRIDLICAQYTKDTNGVESVSLVVKTGTPTTGTPAVPSYTDGSIAGGDTLVEAPLYRVQFNGTSIAGIIAMAETVMALEEVESKLSDALSWKTGGSYTGKQSSAVSLNFGQAWHEIMVSVNVATQAWVNFIIPNQLAFFYNNRYLVNYWGTTSDGYVRIDCSSDGGFAINLGFVNRGTVDITSTAPWEIYYR